MIKSKYNKQRQQQSTGTKTVCVCKCVKEANKMAKNIDDSKLSYRRKVRFELPKSGNYNQLSPKSSPSSSSPSSSPSSPPVLITVTEHRPTTMNSIYSATTTAKKNEPKVHGTGNYVNGTLNFSTNDFSRMLPGKTQQSNSKTTDESIKSESASTYYKRITFRNQLTNDASAKYARKNCSIDQQYWDNAINRRGILLHVSSENQSTNQIKFRNNRIHRYTSILLKPTQVRFFHRSKASTLNTSNTLELPTLAQQMNKMQPKPKSKRNPFERFSYKLISIKKPNAKMRDHDDDDDEDSDDDNNNNNNNDDDDRNNNNNDSPPLMQPVSSVDFNERALSIVQQNCCALNNSQCELVHHCTSQNLSEILQNLNRWQCTTMTTTMPSLPSTPPPLPHTTLPTNDNHLRGAFNHSVEFCTLKKLDVKQ